MRINARPTRGLFGMWVVLVLCACAAPLPNLTSSPGPQPTAAVVATSGVLPTQVPVPSMPATSAAISTTVAQIPDQLPECDLAAGRAPQVASYCMNVQLDPTSKTVAGIERITYQNPSSDTLHDIWLRLYLRAFRDENTIWMQESSGQSRGYQVTPDQLGDITLKSLTLNDGTDLLSSAILTDTLLHVSLPQPLMSGEKIALKATWLSKLPRVFARTGYGGRDDTFFMVGQWYPKLAVYDQGHWDTEPWHTNSEFFNDFGSYDVRITVPQAYVVASVGEPVGEPQSGTSNTTHHFRASDVTDFAFAASPDFQVRSAQAGKVDVELYYLPEHAGSVDEYIQSSVGSLQAYNDWYGEYPHSRLSIVDVPDDAGGAGGMEYPTLVTGGTYGLPPGSGAVTLVVSHEIGHQWWPMQTATNESREPWLDEGLTEYSSMRYMAAINQTVAFFGFPSTILDFEQTQYFATEQPATLPAWKYAPDEYGSAVYAKTALGLWTLESVVGTAPFRHAMATYLSQYRFKHPTAADFRHVIEQSLGPQNWFFDDYMAGPGVVDYGVDSITNRGGTSTVQISRVGTVRVPVDIQITLADGKQKLETWDGQTQSINFSFSAEDAVNRVEIDPDHKLKAELDLENNDSMQAP